MSCLFGKLYECCVSVAHHCAIRQPDVATVTALTAQFDLEPVLTGDTWLTVYDTVNFVYFTGYPNGKALIGKSLEQVLLVVGCVI